MLIKSVGGPSLKNGQVNVNGHLVFKTNDLGQQELVAACLSEEAAQAAARLLSNFQWSPDGN